MLRKFCLLLVMLLVASSPALSQEDVRVPFEPEEGSLEGLRVVLDPTDETSILTAGHLRHYLRDAGARAQLTLREVPQLASDEGKAIEESLAINAHFGITIEHATGESGLTVSAEMADGEKNRKMLDDMKETLLKGMGKGLKQMVVEARDNPSKTNPKQTSPLITVRFGLSDKIDRQQEAEALYWGIQMIWKKYRKTLEKMSVPSREFLAEEEQRRSRHSWRRDPAASVARSVWPFETGPKDEKEAQWVLDTYKRGLTDPTFFYIDATIEKDGDQWTLIGATNNASIREMIHQLLLKLDCRPLQNKMELLPSDKLGEQLYGLCRTSTALSWGEPREGRSVQTQLLLGERLFLLDESPDKRFLLVHGGDGYIGWVREDSVMRLNKEQFSYWEMAPMVLVTEDLKVSGMRVPAGAWLPQVSNDGDTVSVHIPEPNMKSTGYRKIDLPMDSVNLPREPYAGDVVIETAMKFMGVPYVFGAKSGLGIDCSGLTGISYRAVGVNLPRDAKQQVLVGQLVGTPWHMDSLRPGDLIFFASSTGRVSHTGLSLGGKRFVHASAPEVRISSFDPKDKTYSEKLLEEFVFARRPIP